MKIKCHHQLKIKRATSVIVDLFTFFFVKLETNKTQNIMEYHDFIFDSGLPVQRQRTKAQSIDCKTKNKFFFIFYEL